MSRPAIKTFISKYHGPCLLCVDRIVPGQVCSPIVKHWAHASCVEEALARPCCIKCMDENRIRPLGPREDHSICDDCWPSAPEQEEPECPYEDDGTVVQGEPMPFPLEEYETDYDYEPDVTDGYYAAAEYQYEQRQAR